MIPVTIYFDMRAPDFGPKAIDLYNASLDQCEWADKQGLYEICFTEHHATSDGYLPSPIVLAAAAAGRTRTIPLSIKLLLLALYDPIRLAEDLAVLDLVSNGRLRIAVGGGYRPEEYEQFGIDFKRRPALMDENVEVLKKAWTGEMFEYKGRKIRVLPRPLQQPRPEIAMGGSSAASAKRAARIADSYIPTTPELYDLYLEERKKLGRPPPPESHRIPADILAVGSKHSVFIHVSKNPERDWEKVGPHLLHDMNEYARWTAAIPGATGYAPVKDLAALRAMNICHVMTPQQCIDHARKVGSLTVKPLTGGIPPDLAWESLRLIETDVLPRLR